MNVTIRDPLLKRVSISTIMQKELSTYAKEGLKPGNTKCWEFSE